MISETINRITKMKKRTLAMPAAPAANPPKPKTAATIAITKKTAAQYNIIDSSSVDQAMSLEIICQFREGLFVTVSGILKFLAATFHIFAGTFHRVAGDMGQAH